MLAAGALGYLADRSLEVFNANRLGEIAVHARLETSLSVAGHGVGGHGQDQNVSVGALFLLADRLGGVESVLTP